MLTNPSFLLSVVCHYVMCALVTAWHGSPLGVSLNYVVVHHTSPGWYDTLLCREQTCVSYLKCCCPPYHAYIPLPPSSSNKPPSSPSHQLPPPSHPAPPASQSPSSLPPPSPLPSSPPPWTDDVHPLPAPMRLRDGQALDFVTEFTV